MTAASLPERAYAFHPTTGATIMVRRGEKGFYPVATDTRPEILNKVRGVTPQQAAAMLAGSMFGWDVPLANPDHFTEAEALSFLAPKTAETWR